MEMLQDQAQSILHEYIKNTYPSQEAAVRIGRLMLAVSLLKMIRPATIELLFFRETVGDTSVMRLLQDMYVSDHLKAHNHTTAAEADNPQPEGDSCMEEAAAAAAGNAAAADSTADIKLSSPGLESSTAAAAVAVAAMAVKDFSAIMS